jgi:hypothetical protein
VAAPAAVEEGCLEDDLVAPADGGGCLGGGGAELVAAVLDRAVQLDPGSVAAGGFEVGEVALLVLEATLANEVELGVGPVGPVDEAGRGGLLEVGQVLAGEVTDEVGRRVDGLPVDQLHLSGVSAAPVTPRLSLVLARARRPARRPSRILSAAISSPS